MNLRSAVIGGIHSIAPRFAFNYAKRLYHRVDDLTIRPRIVKHTFGGVPLSLHIEDRGALAWYDHDWPEPQEIQLLATGRLRSGATVFDVGAHQAVVAMMLARVVGPAGKVIAVEANQHCADIARKNLVLNACQNVCLLRVAAAAQSGQVHFTDSDHVDRAEPGMGKTIVKAVSIDDLAAEFGFPDVLFIDVEGYECDVLRGAIKTLQHGPDLFIEVHVGAGLEAFGHTTADVLKYISPQYEILVAAPPDGEFRPFNESDEVMKQRFFLIARLQDAGNFQRNLE